MGLDFNTCDAHWAYSGFNRFRNRLALEIGIDLNCMEGFGGDRKWDNIIDPIIILLNHSDCDGEISWEDCKIVHLRLFELIKNWADDDYDKIQALELIRGMKDCMKNQVDLIFC